MALTIAYLVHDLSDAAVRRRVRMLQLGGAEVLLAGFRRSADPVAEVAGVVPIDLGRTRDARLARRALSVARATFSRALWPLAEADVVVARNLEMLALAVASRPLRAAQIPVVYECLDIHRTLLGDGAMSRGLRALESTLVKRTSLVITSSPAFVERYFSRRFPDGPPVRLIENKVLSAHTGPISQPARPAGPPWRIGWFGAIRCRRSLAILADLARRSEGRIEVVIRGRPALTEFADFDRTVAETPHLSFLGAYRNPEDLAGIYGDVHFTWAIDFFEEAGNSDWLLPNRLYEGGLHGAVPLAMAGVETGRFLAAKGIGVGLGVPLAESLSAFFAELDAARYAALAEAAAAVPRATWTATAQDCCSLIAELGALRASPQSTPAPAARL